MRKVMLLVLCLALMAGSASAMVGYSSYNSGAGGNSQPMMVPSYGGYGYGGAYGHGYGGYGSGYNGYGCGTYQPSMEYCTKWIPGHWIQVRVMMPGRWVYRPVWIPAYPKAQYKWVPGFWQTTGKNVRPDLQIWGSPQMGWFGRPYQSQTAGGYFTPQGVWVPAQ